MLATRKIAEARLQKSRGRSLYLFIMPLVVLSVVVWEESGLQRWIYDELVHEMHFLKTSGEGWSVWDQTSPLVTYPKAHFEPTTPPCQWAQYRGKYPISVCLPIGEDSSAELARRGFSAECRAFRQQYWRKGVSNRNVVDVGSGCVMEFLANTDAKLVIFEDDPSKLFHLTTTLLKNPQFIERISLFPISLTPNTEGRPHERFDDLILSGTAQIINIDTVNACQILDSMAYFSTKALLVRTLVEVPLEGGRSLAGDCRPEQLIQKLQTLSFRSATGTKLRSRAAKTKNFEAYHQVAKNKRRLDL
jgi:hypothetical protein